MFIRGVILFSMIASVSSVCIDNSYTSFVVDPNYVDLMCQSDMIEFVKPSVSALSCLALCGVFPNCSSAIFYYGNSTCYGINTEYPFATSSPLIGAVFYRPAMTQSNPPTTTIPPEPITTSTTTLPQVATTLPPTLTAATTTPTTTIVTTAPPPSTTTASPTTTPLGCVSSGYMVASVADSQLNASSEFLPYYRAYEARLDNPTIYCWTAGVTSNQEWIQVDFISERIVLAVIIQGDDEWGEWVETFKFLYSSDCDFFSAVKDSAGNDVIFQGNFDGLTQVINELVPAISGRCFRINPQSWNIDISVKFDLRGCNL